MGILNKFFGGKDTGGSDAKPAETANGATQGPMLLPCAREPLDITLDLLLQLFPIRTLEGNQLVAFAFERKAEVCNTGSLLFRANEPLEFVHYLLDGRVLMDLPDGKSYIVEANTPKARFPLCSGKTYSATARAETVVQFLRVSPRIMATGSTDQERQEQHVLDPHDSLLPEAVRDSRLFQAFCDYYREEELQIPTLPEIALKLRSAVASDVSVREVAGIIQLDPVIAAKIVHVANSPLYLPARPITSCQDAVARLGLSATRSLVTAFCLKQVFSAKNPDIKRALTEQWRQSVYLSNLCFVLASGNDGIDPEEALLAGLLCDIGIVPFLCFAENLPATFWTPEDLKLVTPHVQGPVGAYVLNKWDFSAELAQIPLLHDSWLHDGGDRLTLGDIVVMSKLHAFIGTPKAAGLPAINSIPACGKLRDQRLSPEYSLQVLHEAKDRIAQAMKLFDL